MDDMGGSSLQERMIAEQVRGTETSMVSYRGDLPDIEEHRFPGGCRKSWFRMLHRAEWAWHGISPVETEEVLSRIAASEAKRSRPGILDTVAQYGPGNWIYEFSAEAGQVLREAKPTSTPRPPIPSSAATTPRRRHSGSPSASLSAPPAPGKSPPLMAGRP